MTKSRLTTEERLQRQVCVATVLFAASFAAGTYALRPFALEMSEAFAKDDPGPFPFTRAHVGVAHIVACAAFCATLLQSFTTYTFCTHPLKSQVALLVVLVNVVSATLYAAKCAGHVTVVASGVPGEHMMPLRYLQWLFTTGCLIRTLGCLLPDGPRAQAVLRNTLLTDAIMLVLGALERALPAPQNSVAYVLASIGFVFCLRGQWELFRLGAQTLSTPSDRAALLALRRMTTFTWCLFPAARIAAMSGLLHANGEEVAFSLLDVAAKFGYATFLLVGSFKLADKGAE